MKTTIFTYGFEKLGGYCKNFFTEIGSFVYFLKELFHSLINYRFRWHLLFRQLEFVGNKSFSIILLSSLFTGGVLGLQLGVIFRLFGAEGMMGGATAKALALELAPVMCGFIVTGRAGAAMAAEIGTMRVSEQVDAIQAMGINPLNYLVVPKVIASTIMLPFLTGIFLFNGVVGCYVIGNLMYNVDQASFLDQLRWLVVWNDVLKGLVKSAAFGFILSSVACFKGYYARGGAKGVGEATTYAVVISLLSILIVDFIITLFQI